MQMILKLLGDVVLISIHPLTKRPVGKSWQKRTRESMKDSLYLRTLSRGNIGVLLGKASGGLCTIDIDSDADIEPFLVKNPGLQSTTRTKRVRGCNLWIYVDGDFPPSTKLKTVENGAARAFGEWRADGNQTIIYGRAIDRSKGETEPTEYRFVNKTPPIHARFDELTFPEGNAFNERKAEHPHIRLNSESCISASLHGCVTASLHNNADTILGNITAKAQAQKALAAKHPNLVRLYTEFIEPRYQAQVHARNDFIKEAVPFLYRAVGAPFVLELVGHFYDCNQALFHDPREQHTKEAKAMLESVIETYKDSLSARERGIYEALNEQEQGAFRICRDLALLSQKEREPLTFYLSFNHLADRLGIFPMQAQRIMRQLEIYGLIRLLTKGTRRGPGVKGEAGIYRWQLPSPQVQTSIRID